MDMYLAIPIIMLSVGMIVQSLTLRNLQGQINSLLLYKGQLIKEED